MPNLQGTVIQSEVTKKLRKNSNLRIAIDKGSGYITIHSFHRGNDKTLILTLDEMPERYQVFLPNIF